MKITKRALRQIIKEEITRSLQEQALGSVATISSDGWGEKYFVTSDKGRSRPLTSNTQIRDAVIKSGASYVEETDDDGMFTGWAIDNYGEDAVFAKIAPSHEAASMDKEEALQFVTFPLPTEWWLEYTK